jgi:hypothetical protein
MRGWGDRVIESFVKRLIIKIADHRPHPSFVPQGGTTEDR